MNTTIQTILDFSQFYLHTVNAKLPIKTAYKLSRLAKAADTEMDFYRTKFNEILAEFCQTDDNGKYVYTEDGQGYKILEGREYECNQAMTDLHELEIELPDITFTIEEFDGIELTINELDGIMPFIVD